MIFRAAPGSSTTNDWKFHFLVSMASLYLVCFFINHLIGLSCGFILLLAYQTPKFHLSNVGLSNNLTIQGDGATFIPALFEGQSSTIVQCSQEGVGGQTRDTGGFVNDSKLSMNSNFLKSIFLPHFCGDVFWWFDGVCIKMSRFWVLNMNVSGPQNWWCHKSFLGMPSWRPVAQPPIGQ